MELMITNPTGYALTNKKLATATARIYKLGEKVRTNLYQIAQELVKIDNGAMYEDDGFKSVYEYAEAVLGIKKTFSHNLVRIGREYTAPELSGSNLPHDEDQDYTVTQVQMMLPISRDEVVEIIEAGDITPDMTCREISKVVKDYKNGKNGDKAESETDESETDESETAESETAEEDARERAIQNVREALANLVPHITSKMALKRTVSNLIDEVYPS